MTGGTNTADAYKQWLDWHNMQTPPYQITEAELRQAFQRNHQRVFQQHMQKSFADKLEALRLEQDKRRIEAVHRRLMQEACMRQFQLAGDGHVVKMNLPERPSNWWPITRDCVLPVLGLLSYMAAVWLFTSYCCGR
jgi:hypothetical protein